MNTNNLQYPGGCEIGLRPIDLHIKGLKQLGVNIIETHGYIIASAEKLIGADINLDIPSVGATQNIMFAAVSAKGTTIIRNAAKEPEITDLQNFLNSMGAKISGAGTNVIRIEGADKFGPAEHKIMPDRIIAGTYMTAAAITGGTLELENVEEEHIHSIISKLRECGCSITCKDSRLKIVGADTIFPSDVRTLPYPGYPTDMQAQIVAYLTLAEGTSIVTETIFENRFKYVEELMKMGADIRIDGRTAIIRGVKKLTGASVISKDLRGGAALIIAGLAAQGETIVSDSGHIERGYQSIEERLASAGAKIIKVDN